jgi:hypothetical protein
MKKKGAKRHRTILGRIKANRFIQNKRKDYKVN